MYLTPNTFSFGIKCDTSTKSHYIHWHLSQYHLIVTSFDKFSRKIKESYCLSVASKTISRVLTDVTRFLDLVNCLGTASYISNSPVTSHDIDSYPLQPRQKSPFCHPISQTTNKIYNTTRYHHGLSRKRTAAAASRCKRREGKKGY